MARSDRAGTGFGPADRLLRAVARRSVPWLVVLAVGEIAGTATTLWLPEVLGAGVDDVLAGRAPYAALGRIGAVLAAEAVAIALSIVAAARLTTDATAWLRRRMLGHVLALGLGARNSPANMTTRLVSDVQPVAATAPVLLSGAIAVVGSIGGFVALALIDWPLAAVVACGLPLAWWVARALVKDVSGQFNHYAAILATIAERLADALGGARTIRAYGTVDREVDRVLEPLPELSSAGHAVWRAQARATLQLGTLTPLLTVAVLAVAGFGIAGGRLTAGDFVAAGAYAGIALSLLDHVESLVDLAHARGSAARVAEVLDEPAAEPGHAALPPGSGELALHDVTVEDGGGARLDRVTLRVRPGSTVALVGDDASGAATLAAVAAGLCRPDRGAVVLDGVPLDRLGAADRARAVACAFAAPSLVGVPSDGTALGGATVADAIALGRPDAPPADVVRAAVAAHADAFVRRLPQGYRTPLADAPLSGGELQRLGLARALACGARLTVFDDAAANLDVATEAMVGAAVTTRLAGRTQLVRTRRAATAARTDLVVWMDRGRVRAVAPHASLWGSPEYRAALGHDGRGPR